jgi:hypothetical protein
MKLPSADEYIDIINQKNYELTNINNFYFL